ncbi:hypothetical protein PHPALM_28240 [Phytophthora palmivora]|uniref:Uncharacterized protein n=1 Tax=Phytophthora palmivora TaxID=4796 RepID=A0A2P4XAQ1_9STRA|nr:hypothetical protein PHPALM_28240 [Phytophthora palmivora]
MSAFSTLSAEFSDDFDPLIYAWVKTNVGLDDALMSPPILNKKLPAIERDAKRKLFLYERQKRERAMLHKELARLSIILKQEETTKNMTAETKRKRDGLVWKALAKQCLRERLDAETRRKWLLTAISGKRALIEDLKSVVRQHILLANLGPTYSGHTGLFLEPPDELFYAMEMQDINHLYRQTDSVFSTCSLDPASSETTPFQRTVTKNSEGTSIQLVRRQHFLFSYKQTWQAVWMLSHMMHRCEDRENYPGIDDPENTMATKFRITKQVPGGECLFVKESLVSRKFHEDNRTVLVWKASLTGEGSFRGMRTEETGWSIIRPSTAGPGCVYRYISKRPVQF